MCPARRPLSCRSRLLLHDRGGGDCTHSLTQGKEKAEKGKRRPRKVESSMDHVGEIGNRNRSDEKGRRKRKRKRKRRRDETGPSLSRKWNRRDGRRTQWRTFRPRTSVSVCHVYYVIDFNYFFGGLFLPPYVVCVIVLKHSNVTAVGRSRLGRDLQVICGAAHF